MSLIRTAKWISAELGVSRAHRILVAIADHLDADDLLAIGQHRQLHHDLARA